jgi:hypothetical protein
MHILGAAPYEDGYFYRIGGGLWAMTDETYEDTMRIYKEHGKLSEEVERLSAEKTELMDKLKELSGRVQDLTSKLAQLETSKDQMMAKTIVVEGAKLHRKRQPMDQGPEPKPEPIRELQPDFGALPRLFEGFMEISSPRPPQGGTTGEQILNLLNDQPRRFSDLVKLTGRSEPIVAKWIRRLVQSGKVMKGAGGEYRLVGKNKSYGGGI